MRFVGADAARALTLRAENLTQRREGAKGAKKRGISAGRIADGFSFLTTLSSLFTPSLLAENRQGGLRANLFPHYSLFSLQSPPLFIPENPQD